MTKKQIIRAVTRSLTGKTNLSESKISEVVDDVVEQNPSTPWWVVVLKVIAYAIGIILAGYGTASAATTFLPFVQPFI